MRCATQRCKREADSSYRRCRVCLDASNRRMRRYRQTARGQTTSKIYRASIPGSRSKRQAGIRYSYGLTLEEFEALLQSQGGACAICPQTQHLHLDHDHTTGQPRGFLCANHNRAMGHFNDDPQLLRAAADYLERSIR